MDSSNKGSSQFISKFIRTSTDIDEITKVINSLLDDAHCVLPNKNKFILELIGNRLSNDINSANSNPDRNNAKRQKKTQLTFYDNVEIWKIISFFLVESSADEYQEIGLLKSIKYLDLFNMVILKQDAKLLIEFVKVLSTVLRRNLLQLPMYLNKNKYYFQKFLTIVNNYMSLSSNQILSDPEILLKLFQYMKNNGTIDVDFNNPSLLSQTLKIKDIVKFYKDNSQFIIQFFISNNLLDKLLVISSNLSSESVSDSSKSFDRLLNELIHLFIKNSITFEVDDFTKFNFSTLAKHFNVFISDDKAMNYSVSSFSATKLYELILENVINDTKKYHGYNDALNEALFSSLMNFKKIDIELLLEMNIKYCQLTHFSSEYLSSFYEKNSSGEKRKFISISKSELLSKSTKEIKSMYNGSEFSILAKLIFLDCRRSLNNNDFQDNDKNKSNLCKFGFQLIWIAFHCKSPYSEHMIENVINHYSQQSYALLYLLGSYKEILFILEIDNGENEKRISFLRNSNDLLSTKLNLLSIPQLDNQITACIDHFEKGNYRDYYWGYMIFLLKYLFTNHRLSKFVNNSNHKVFLRNTLTKLVKAIEVKNEFYYKSIYLILNILDNEIPDFVTLYVAELKEQVCLKIKTKNKIGFYEMSLIFMTLEYSPANVTSNELEKLLSYILAFAEEHEHSDKLDFLNLLFIRYFTLFSLIDDQNLVSSIVGQLLQSFLQEENNGTEDLNVLRNPLIYENQNVRFSIVDFLVKNSNSKQYKVGPALQKLLLCVPVECFDKKSKIQLLNNELANAQILNPSIIEYLLSTNPTYESKIENDPSVLFSKKFLNKNVEKIVLLIVNNHMKRANLSCKKILNCNEDSFEYLSSLTRNLHDFFEQKKLDFENLNETFNIVSVTNEIFKAIEDNPASNKIFGRLRSVYSDFLFSYLDRDSLGNEINQDIIPVQNLILQSIQDVPSSFIEKYDGDAKIRIEKGLINLLTQVSSMDLKISIFGALPSFSQCGSDSEVKNSRFNVFYLDLFTVLANDPNQTVCTGDNKNLLYQNMQKYLRKFSEDEFFLLYSLILTKENGVAGTPDVGDVDLFLCFLSCLKERKNDFKNIKWKKLLVDTCSKFLQINFSELKDREIFVKLASKIIETLIFVITNMHFLISQYSFELILLLVYKVSSCYRMIDMRLYKSLFNVISKILLVYRFRLAGRYHLLIEIYKMLFLKLTLDYNKLGTLDSNQEKTRLVEQANLFTRSVGNLVQPNEQAAKSLTKKKSTLVSNVNLIKRDLRTHLPNLVLFYIKTSLSSSFNIDPQIKPLLQNDCIFLIFDLLSSEEFAIINATLDFSGRAYYKTIYENYNKFGKWKSS